MVPENDMSIVRIMARIHPHEGERDNCLKIIREITEITKPQARDYHYYNDPETGDIVNWQSFDTVGDLVDVHSPSVRPQCIDLVGRSDVVKYHVYVDNEPEVIERLRVHFSGWLPAVFMLPI